MTRKLTALLVILFTYQFLQGQSVSLKSGMIIKKSVVIKKGTYHFKIQDSSGMAAILISGNDLVIDFNNAILIGNDSKQKPDGFTGIAIKIIGGHNITIRNLIAKGYKIAVYGNGTDGLKIENCDLSYNYRQHLKSTQKKEDISDWLSFHHNENDEWLRYGAAIYLRGCSNGVVKNVTVTGGENGLMMMECSNALVFNNNISFNSGIGIGMYRCCNNKVLYNRLDFNIRGYSEGVYSRGQDSAGILVYEQSNNNIFYKNSVTHGGDGFFLWAGQTTMDNGTGGSNDNIIRDNDFSFAATNGIEVTFSRNKIIHNRIFGCENGIWAGYSYETQITQNQFRFNHIGIAIEHGQNNDIDHNLFYGDQQAIKLWANKENDPEWGYPRYRDTRSRNYSFVGNSFNNDSIVYSISNTDSIKMFDNRNADYQYLIKADSSISNLDSSIEPGLNIRLSADIPLEIPVIADQIDPFKGLGKLKGRNNIIITEWGPYDFRYPLIRQAADKEPGILSFDVFGPNGKWKIVNTKGLGDIIIDSSSLPARIMAKRSGGTIEIQAAYTGEKFTDKFGTRIIKPRGYLFSFRED